MRSSPLRPQIHFFVCANRRSADDALGGGCGERGARVYAALKGCVAGEAAYARVWVTQTGCLGICPRVGATVAIYPEQRILTEVDEADVVDLYARVTSSRGTP